ncbi:hypothetical protein PMAYCL1PPCAC_04330, partial [Pristionchus mayeri]
PPLTPKSIVSPPTSSLAALSLSPGHHHTLDGGIVPPPPPPPPLGTCYLLPGGGLRPNRNTLPTIAAPTHMCTIVMASHPPVHAVADSKQEARNNAATQALCLLGPALAMLEQKMKEEKETEKGRKRETNKENVADTAGSCSIDASPESTVADVPVETQGGVATEEEGDGRRKKGKSVISQVHECALQMKLTVEFEVISEEGRAHDRSYVVECRLLGGETVLQARGAGRQKREAKQAACAELIETLKKMESSPIHIATVLYKSQRKAALPQSKEPKRKTIVKHMKMDPSYGHQINPVSRLIQVLQARGEPDPVFEFLGEAGQYKYKQFNVQVVVGDLFAEGAGPNKRLAKRAAAELMLELMGVAKRLPEPGKSLLKKREDEPGCAMMSIGVFNAADFMDAPAPAPPVQEKPKKTRKKGGVMWAAEEEKEENEEGDEEEEEERREPKRRVTFNAQVAACTAPDDHAYPMTEVAPLKADDLGCAGKARRRGREGRTRSLNDTQRMALGRAVVAWIEGKEEEQEEDNVFRIESLTASAVKTEQQQRTLAKTKLNKLGTHFGFNPHYTIFPQGESANERPPSASGGRVSSPAPPLSSSMMSLSSREDPMTTSSSAAYFVIVNLPLNKAIMGEGHGASIDDAHEAAAADALRKIGSDTTYVPGAVALSPPPPLQQAKPLQQHQFQQEQRPTSASPQNLQHVQHMQQQSPTQPNPFYNANYGGMSSPSGARPMQQQQHGSPVHHPKDYLQYQQQPQQNGRGQMPGVFPTSFPSPFDLPTMADFYGQFDANFTMRMAGGDGALPSHPSQRPPPHSYPYSNGV